MTRDPSESFDAKDYWNKRHNRFGESVLSVGNLSQSENENLESSEKLKDYISFLMTQMEVDSKDKLLDFGSGIGRLFDVVTNTGADYTGYDISPKAVSSALKKHPKGNFVHGNDLSVIQTSGQRFNYVIAAYVFVHIVNDKTLEETISQIKNLLTPNGKLIILDQFRQQEPTDPLHVKPRSSKFWLQLLSRYGFVENRHFKGMKYQDSLITNNTIIVNNLEI